MAGDWMKVELTLPDKPEVHYIASVLNLDPDMVLGKLLRVWRWFNENTVDGAAHLATFATVDRLAGATGFAEAMQFAGWLKQEGKTLVMPAFDKHTSTSAKKRADAANRMHKARTKSLEGNEDSRNVALSAQQKANISATKAQPEKRREEEEKEKKEDGARATHAREEITLEEEFSGRPKCDIPQREEEGEPERLLSDFPVQLQADAEQVIDRFVKRRYGTAANVPSTYRRSKDLYDCASVIESRPDAVMKFRHYFDKPTLQRNTPFYLILKELDLDVRVSAKVRDSPQDSLDLSAAVQQAIKKREAS